MSSTLYLPALTEYRARTAMRRAEAFCDAPEYVLGTPIRSLTPATFSMLYATRSAFLFAAKPMERDVINFLWIHSPDYCHTGVRGWRRRKRRALRRFMFELLQPWRKLLRLPIDINRYNAILNLAISEIREIIDAAFADAPARSGRPGKPIATLEAFFIHEFAVAYRWDPEFTRNCPLRKINQLHRCIRAARGQELTDEGEDKILADHLKARNEKLAKEREAAHG